MAEQTKSIAAKEGEPYCGNCGYALSGLTDSSKCPECGKPLVEVLSRIGRWGKRYRAETKLFGLPIVDVAYGPAPGEKIGHARGIFALGDKATGVVAIGGMARGVVAIGGLAIGGITFGGFSLGLISAIGGVAIGALVYGGVAVGLVASGGVAIALLAVGGLPIGYAVAGGSPIGVYRVGPGVNDTEVATFLDMFSWYLGPASFGLRNMIQPSLVTFAMGALVAGITGMLAGFAHMRGSKQEHKRTG